METKLDQTQRRLELISKIRSNGNLVSYSLGSQLIPYYRAVVSLRQV